MSSINLDYGFSPDYDDQAFLDNLKWGPGTKRYFQSQFASKVDYYTFEYCCEAFDRLDTDHARAFSRCIWAQGLSVRDGVIENINFAHEHGHESSNWRVY